MSVKSPLVSLGLPVFNGEKYLAQAMESLLAQTYGNFELIVCDNASTDGTEAICRDYASQDRRIRYYRNPRNIGAAPNFNLSFRYSRGTHFKWCAHDDLCAPQFLERCVEVLQKDATAVLAYPKVQIIDAHGDAVEVYGRKLATDSPRPAERFRSLLEGHACFEIFGLIRRQVLENTSLIGGYAHGDGVLLARLALFGRFIEIPEILFFERRHAQQSMTMVKDYRSYAVWFNPVLRGKKLFPYWRMHLEWLRTLQGAPISLAERIACVRHVADSFRKRRRRLIGEIRCHLNGSQRVCS